MAVQVPGQLMPPVLEVTVPVPLPPLTTVTVWVVTAKSALTTTSAETTSEQVVMLPLQAPPHPVKVPPVPAAAVSVTRVPAGTSRVQVAPHERPAGDEVMVPAPAPLRTTVSARGAGPVDGGRRVGGRIGRHAGRVDVAGVGRGGIEVAGIELGAVDGRGVRELLDVAAGGGDGQDQGDERDEGATARGGHTVETPRGFRVTTEVVTAAGR